MEFDQVIKTRRSIRKFKMEPVPEGDIQAILDAGRLAPSVSNIQSTRYIIIKTSEMKAKLNEYTLPFVKNAPVIIVCCAYKKAWADMEERLLQLTNAGAFNGIYDETRQRMENYKKDGKMERVINAQITNNYLWQHAAIAIDHMTLKAVDLGLGSCWIGFVDRTKVKELLGLDDNYEVIALLPIGYPDQNPPQRPRLALDEIVLREL